MFCPKCGTHNGGNVSFCRGCGTDLENLSLTSVKQNPLSKKIAGERLTKAESKDPDELTGNGIGSIVVGDGFFIVAVLLSASDSSVGSLLWLLLLIPAFFLFGKGFADVLHARQIRARQKQNGLSDAPKIAELPPSRASIVDVFKKSISGELAAVPSITEGTTRDLK